MRILATLYVGIVVLALVGLTVVGIVAINDHGRKASRLHVVSVTTWTCRHRGMDCGLPTPQSVESAWNRRERWYLAAASALVFLASTSAVAARRVRRRGARA